MLASNRWSEKTRVMYSCRSMTTGPRFLSVSRVIVLGSVFSLVSVLFWLRVRLFVLRSDWRFLEVRSWRCL